MTMKIENQAMMLAYMSKHAIQMYGEEGREAIQKGMTKYGNERGIRMAKRAAANGEPMELWVEQAYGEWVPDYPGQMEFGGVCNEPVYTTYIGKCAWCEAWKKNDILEYGKEYCVNVDNAVFQGFNKDWMCTPVGASMSFGGEKCVFEWGMAMSEEDAEKMKAKKAELGTSMMKDFVFHTAHIYYTVAGVLRAELGEKAEPVIEKAVEDYVNLFGQADFDALADYADTNWEEI